MSKSNKSMFFWLPFCAILAVTWAFCAKQFLGLDLFLCIRFICFQGFCVFGIGRCLRLLFKINHSFLENLFLDFSFGFLLIIILYFPFACFRLNHYTPIALFVLSFLALVYQIRYSKESPPKFESSFTNDLISILICVIGAALTFVLLSMANLEPSLVGTRNYFHDTMNGVGLTVAASNSFPITSMQMAGLIFPYHIGFYAYTSVMCDAIAATAFEGVIKLSLITIAPICILGFQVLLNRLIQKKFVRYIAALIFAIVPSCAYVHYLYVDTIGYPFGIVLSIAALLMFASGQEYSKKMNHYHLLGMFLLTSATVAKGPIALSYLFGICFVLLIELLRDKNLWVFVKGALYAGLFFSVYFLVYSDGAGDSMSISPLYSATRTEFAYSILDKVPEWVFYVLSTSYYVISFSFVCFAALVALIYGVVKKDTNNFTIFALGSALEAYVMMNVYKQMGSSEIYFLTGLYPVLFAVFLYYFIRLVKEKNLSSRIVCFLCILLCCCSLYRDFGSSYRTYKGDTGTVDVYASGFTAASTFSIRGYDGTDRYSVEEFNGPPITPAEYEAYIWLKNNTEEGDVFADYRYSSNNKFFCASSFSERPCFLEGWGFVTMEDSNDNTEEKIRRDTIMRFFFETKEEPYSRLLASEGVQYLMFEKCITGDWTLSEKYVNKVFENSDVIIYKILEWELD